MATAADVIRVARGELGYYAPADPEEGSKYGRWLAGRLGQAWLRGPSTSIWWCCCFVSWCLERAGQAVPGFPTYNTDLALRGGASALCVDKRSARAGDILIFDWNWATPATDHIGLATAAASGGSVATVEGNVGNRVVERVRSLSLVRHCVRPAYGGAAAPAAQAAPRAANPDPGALVEDGWLGNLSVTRWQLLAGTPADGVVSGQHRPNSRYLYRLNSVTWEGGGSALVRAVQRSVGCEADGILGPQTVRGIQGRVGVAQDGYLGPDTARAVQRRLNSGRW